MNDTAIQLLLFLAVALIFPLIPLGLAWCWQRLFHRGTPGPKKLATYECGVDPQGSVHIRFQSHYYLYALVFLIFDVEAIFLIPIAAAFTQLPVSTLLAGLIFLLLLVESLLWAWAKGILAWK